MITEYQVRQRIELIRASRLAPLRKARLLLKIGRSLGKQAATLNNASERSNRTKELNGTASLARIALRIRLLHEDVRDAAHEALSKASLN